ncbi:unnamed protein product [Coccothraustes coccothraustes]
MGAAAVAGGQGRQSGPKPSPRGASSSPSRPDLPGRLFVFVSYRCRGGEGSSEGPLAFPRHAFRSPRGSLSSFSSHWRNQAALKRFCLPCMLCYSIARHPGGTSTPPRRPGPGLPGEQCAFV